MATSLRSILRAALIVALAIALASCGFLPGFSLLEQPTLYFIPVNDVANRVACEIDEFIAEHQQKPPVYGPHEKWVLADQDIAITLTLSTDESGYVNFTGINPAKLGLESLATFISTQNSVPTLGAKLSAKRSKSAAIKFTVSPTDLQKDKNEWKKCLKWAQLEDRFSKLYLKDWLNNYFETINSGISKYNAQYNQTPDLTEELLHGLRPATFQPPPVPADFKIVSVDLSTQLFLAADISAGATPTILGNGSVFIVPINGLGFDYNPDYANKVDIVMNVCNNTPTQDPFTGAPNPNPCYPNNTQGPPDHVTDLLQEQCRMYSLIRPLLTGVTPPQDVKSHSGPTLKCNSKTGTYQVEIPAGSPLLRMPARVHGGVRMRS